jgi:hypothetical protein
VDVQRAVGDLGRLGDARSLDQSARSDLLEDIAEAVDVGFDQAFVQAEPFAGSLVPDFDAEAARHVLGGNPDRIVAAPRSKMIARAIELVADSGKIAVLDNRDAADPGLGRRRMDRIAVELDRQEPR